MLLLGQIQASFKDKPGTNEVSNITITDVIIMITIISITTINVTIIIVIIIITTVIIIRLTYGIGSASTPSTRRWRFSRRRR
jgi:uncharacterized membrane protein YcaP (DUF421 family)